MTATAKRYRRGSRLWALELACDKFGPKAAVRDNGATHRDGSRRPTCEADREWWRAELRRLQGMEPKRPDLEAWPENATIGEYRAAFAKWRVDFKAWQRQRDIALSNGHSYRFTVGVVLGGFMLEVKGEGDTWEAALQKAGAL